MKGNWSRKWLVQLVFIFGIGVVVTVNSDFVNANEVNNYVKEGITKKGWISPVEQDRVGNIKYQYDYADGFAKPTKIINHETANERSTIEGEISYMILNQENAFVHEFVDAYNIINIADTDYLAWGCGPKGNPTGVQVEQVRVHSKDEFAKEIMNLATFNVMILKQYGLVPTLGQKNGTGSIWTHSMVTYYLGGTNHVDPDGYWADRAGKYFNTTYTINNFYDLVSDMYYGRIQQGSLAEIKTTTKITQNEGDFIADVTVSGDTDRITKVQVPTWNESNGQKDLKWYVATKINANTYRATIPISNHQKLGAYLFHTYVGTDDGVFKSTNSNKMIYKEANVIATTTHQISNGKLVIQTKVTGDTNRITKMQVPIWRENASGNTAIWYPMTKKSEGLYEYVYDGLKGSEYNKVNTHVYATLDNRQLKAVSSNGYEFKQPMITGSTTATVKGSSVELVTRLSGEIDRISSVQFPTWDVSNASKKIWYTAQKVNNTTYKATVPLSDFKQNSSTYMTHSYIQTTESKLQYYATTSFSYQQLGRTETNQFSMADDTDSYSKLELEAINQISITDDAAIITTTLSGETQDVIKVDHLSWGAVNPSEKVWYSATKQNDTTWVTVMPLQEFQMYGDYTIDTYVTINNSNKKLVGNTLVYTFEQP